MDLSAIDGIVSDMDGVLWRGDTALPGLAQLFVFARTRALPLVLATNNSTRSETEYAGKLRRLGVEGVAEDRIVTSRVAMADHLRRHYPAGSRIYVVGSAGLAQLVEASGFVLAEEAEIVVVGLDPALSYDKLKRATRLILAGAAFLGTNGDPSVPGEDGVMPGAGAILAALETATGRRPTLVGKPEPAMFEAALRRLGTAPNRTLMIGDRLATDIAGAKRAGLKAVLVLTGSTRREDLTEPAPEGPDAVHTGLPELLAAWADALARTPA